MISARVERLKLIKKYPEKLREVNNKFLPKAALDVEAEAVRRVPVGETGMLKGSIKSRVDDDQAIIGTNLEYAPYVEYGTGIHAEGGKGRKTPWVYFSDKLNRFVYTRGMRAQPFLRPAIDNQKTKLIALYRKIFRSVYGK